MFFLTVFYFNVIIVICDNNKNLIFSLMIINQITI